MKKLCSILLVLIFFSSSALPAYAYNFMPEYLCEIGVKFYHEGRYAEALQEFNKVLLIEANYEPALKYIYKIQELESKELQEESSPVSSKRDAKIENLLSSLEKPVRIKPAKKIPPKVIMLDELLARATGTLEIEQGKSLSLYIPGIQRFLVTEPNIINVERKNPGEISVTGNDLGYTYLYIWDANGRRTLEILTIPPKPKGEALEDMVRRGQGKERNFRLAYSMDWSSYTTGKDLDNLRRSNYHYVHNLKLDGQTPYGNLDSSLAVNRYNQNTDLVHYTLGLTNGKFGDFKDFTLRGFDFFDIPPSFSNLSFPGRPLRGVMLSSPAFNNKLDYTVFYGKENWSGFSGLSPTLNQEREAFLEGFNIGFTPTKKQSYKFTLVHGWGADRDPVLESMGYDLMGDWLLDKWKLNYELASDTNKFANLLNAHYLRPNLSFNAQFRDIDKSFNSITGSGWDQGQLGALFNFDYRPVEKLEIYSSLDLYQDRLYPAGQGNVNLNEDFNWNSTYRIDPLTSVSLNYALQNELGRITRYRYQNIDAGINRNFKFFKDINLFLKYFHQENDNFSSPVSDYGNERIYAGAKVSLTRDLFYYANQEINWLTEKSTGNKSNPSAFETGLNYSGQFYNSPFFTALRFTYRDEQDTLSNLSFLSGEDYIEGYAELSYRPTVDAQIYGSCRARNVWADNPNVLKRIEASVNAGLRLAWDTGLNWQAVGDIEGYVFKDLNSNGILEKGEPPVGKVKVWLGKSKSAVTDALGYYKFKKVRGNQVNINLDTATIPSGFVLTVPANQLVFISQNQTRRVDFGIVSRSEIYGYVFEDLTGDNQLGKKSKGIRNVVVMLEDGSKRSTDNNGKYSFPNVSPGEHQITLDLESLPVYYLPKTVLTKKITLFEGVAYNYNIPLKRIKE